MCCLTEDDRDLLDPPPNENGPLFVYGALKPGELGYEQVKTFVASAEPATVLGALRYRDGIPLLMDKEGEVRGFLLTFDLGAADRAWRAVRAFEPPHQYRWAQLPVNTGHGSLRANVLLGRSPEKASVPADQQPWSTASDPMFGEGLTEVRRMTLELAPQGISPTPDTAEYWRTFFRLQAVYLLLWSVAERYSALCFGPALGPMERLRRLEADPNFRRAVVQSGAVSDAVFDSRRPDDKVWLGVNGLNAASYWYQVRSNLSHRGKSAFQDGKLIFKSLVELHDTLRIVLKSRVPRLVERWVSLDPVGEEVGWLLRPSLPEDATRRQ